MQQNPQTTCVSTLKEQAVGEVKISDLPGGNLAISEGNYVEQTYGVPALATGTQGKVSFSV